MQIWKCMLCGWTNPTTTVVIYNQKDDCGICPQCESNLIKEEREDKEIKEIIIPIPKHDKLIIIVDDNLTGLELDHIMAQLQEFHQNEKSALIVRESIIKKIYLVNEVEMTQE